MTVDELIVKLKKMPQYATVCVEVWSDPEPRQVKAYTNGSETYVYIGDDFDNLDWELEEQGFELVGGIN